MNGVSRITTHDDVALITIRSQTSDQSLVGEIFNAFATANVVIDMISQTVPQGSTMDISFTTDSQSMVTVLTVINRIKEQYKQLKIMVTTNNCKVQLFGEEMRQMTGVASSAIQILLKNAIDIIMITTSEVDISFIISPAHHSNAIERLETLFDIKAEL